MFNDIKVLVWDFDFTFFPPNRELSQAVREGEFRTIMNHTGWNYAKAKEEFLKIYKVVSPSGTYTVSTLSGISIKKACAESEKYYDRTQYLRPDPRLVRLFVGFSNFRHLILANGVKAKIEKTLQFLGISPKIFEAIITPELTGMVKPNEHAFQAVLDFTKLPAGEHLMIGDREAVDLAPAKKLGFKTCLVWSNIKSEIADITLPTVYDVSRVLMA